MEHIHYHHLHIIQQQMLPSLRQMVQQLHFMDVREQTEPLIFQIILKRHIQILFLMEHIEEAEQDLLFQQPFKI